MEIFKIAKQTIHFQKATLDNVFKAMTVVQEQTEKMAGSMLDQAAWLPEEGRETIKKWLQSYQTGRENFQQYVDESFKKVDTYFTTAEETISGKANK